MKIAIVLSGGIGSRIGDSVPKQYIRVNEKRLIFFPLEVIARSKLIDNLCIVAAKEWEEVILKECNCEIKGKFIGFAQPGENRQMSIFNALEYIKDFYGSLSNNDIVFIHDAARPYLTEEMIENYTMSIVGHDGVLPVIPLNDTVYISSDGYKISGLCDRETLFCGQAPELFVFNKYYEANLKLLPKKILKIHGSSEPAIMDGLDVVMVKGCENNVKITTRRDLEQFQG